MKVGERERLAEIHGKEAEFGELGQNYVTRENKKG